MRVCGIGFAEADAALLVLDVEGGWTLVPTRPARLILGDPFDTEAVRHFRTAVGAFLDEHGIEHIANKRMPHKGKMPAGPAAFAMSAVIQVTSHVPITFLTPQAIKAARKADAHDLPDGGNKYQVDAFGAALGWVHR